MFSFPSFNVGVNRVRALEQNQREQEAAFARQASVGPLYGSPEARVRAFARQLHRDHGEDASRLIDIAVGEVQLAMREPRDG